MTVIERTGLDRAIKCTCGSTAVIDTTRHAEDCTRRLWREYTDAVDGQLQGAVKAERERIANMLARDADSDERGGFDERTRTVLRSYARTIAGGQSAALPLPRTDQPNTTEETP